MLLVVEQDIQFGKICEVTVAGYEFRERTARGDRGAQIIKRERRALFDDVLAALNEDPGTRAVAIDSGTTKFATTVGCLTVIVVRY